jgi:5-hydroxyisourate hydrolase
MSKISTHVLDAVVGKPAAGISVRLHRMDGKTNAGGREDPQWTQVAVALTDADGRCRDLAPDAPAGVFRLTFETGPYMSSFSRRSIYPQISITFHCDGTENYHLPLLLSDNSYTTYRGS